MKENEFRHESCLLLDQTKKQKQMRTLFILFIGFFYSFGAFAQPDTGYDDLKILFADENYEKLVRQCEKYMEKDDTKKDPLPYLWMTKALYAIDISGSDNDNFKNAFKDGISYLGKCFKYDTDGMVQDEHSDFIDEFSMACVERITNDISAEDFRKAYGWTVKYKKIARNEAGVLFMEGALKFRNGDKGGANTAWKDGNKLLDETTSIEDWAKADVRLLRQGVIESANAMVAGRQLDKAKDLLNKVAPWFEEDENFKEAYDAIVN